MYFSTFEMFLFLAHEMNIFMDFCTIFFASICDLREHEKDPYSLAPCISLQIGPAPNRNLLTKHESQLWHRPGTRNAGAKIWKTSRNVRISLANHLPIEKTHGNLLSIIEAFEKECCCGTTGAKQRIYSPQVEKTFLKKFPKNI